MTKQFLPKSRWLVTIILLTTLCVSQMWADYTVTFKTVTTEETSVPTINKSNLISSGGDYVNSVSGARIYRGTSSNGLKFGSNSYAGNIVLTMTSTGTYIGQIQASAIKFNDAKKTNGNLKYTITYTDDATTASTQSLTTTAANYTIKLDSTKTVKSVKIENTATKKQFYVKGFTILVGYTITYDCDGASSGCPTDVSHTRFLPNPLPSAPTKAGYTFDGWYTNAGKTVEAVAGATLTGNTTLYAKWTAAASCTANPSIGTASLNGSFNMTSTTSAIGVASGTCSTGNAACDWTDYGFVWSDGANTTTPTVGGTNCNKVQVGTSGNGTSWTGSVTPSGSTTPTSWTTGHTYYVRTYGKNSKTGAEFVHGTAFSFTPRSITFNSNGGSAVSTIYVNSGTAASAPTAPTRDHFTFNGWYTDSGLETSVDWSSTISEDKTYYAKWTEDPYKTVVFKNNDDEIDGYASVKVYVGERPTPPTLTDGHSTGDACDEDSETFYGWTTSTWSGTIATQASMEEDYTVYVKNADLPVVTAGDPATITYNAVWAEAVGVPSDEYQLVTNISQLSAGDKIVIANAGSSSTYLMGKDTVTEAGYQFRKVAQGGTFSISSSKITISTSASSSTDRTNPHVFTVGKSGVYWTFYDPLNSAYISCASIGDSGSDAKNGLGYENSLSDAGKWDISISGDNKATILSQIGTSTRNRLQANGNPFSTASSFTCSKNTMTDPYIFRNLATLGYQNYMTTCCDYNITFSDNDPSNGSVAFTASSYPVTTIATCSATEADRQVTMTIDPADGYQLTGFEVATGDGTVPTAKITTYPAVVTNNNSNATQEIGLTFAQETSGAYNVTATFGLMTVTSWTWTMHEGGGAISDPLNLYIGQSARFDVAYTPSGVDASKKTYERTKVDAYINWVGAQQATYSTISGKASTGENTTAVTFTHADGPTKTVNVKVLPLPKVHFVDHVHNAAFADVVATIEDNALSKDKTTPARDDWTTPNANTCEGEHLHLTGWILSTWADEHPNATHSEITSAGSGVYYNAGAAIDVDAQDGKTFYAVWGKEVTE